MPDPFDRYRSWGAGGDPYGLSTSPIRPIGVFKPEVWAPPSPQTPMSAILTGSRGAPDNTDLPWKTHTPMDIRPLPGPSDFHFPEPDFRTDLNSRPWEPPGSPSSFFREELQPFGGSFREPPPSECFPGVPSPLSGFSQHAFGPPGE